MKLISSSAILLAYAQAIEFYLERQVGDTAGAGLLKIRGSPGGVGDGYVQSEFLNGIGDWSKDRASDHICHMLGFTSGGYGGYYEIYNARNKLALTTNMVTNRQNFPHWGSANDIRFTRTASVGSFDDSPDSVAHIRCKMGSLYLERLSKYNYAYSGLVKVRHPHYMADGYLCDDVLEDSYNKLNREDGVQITNMMKADKLCQMMGYRGGATPVVLSEDGTPSNILVSVQKDGAGDKMMGDSNMCRNSKDFMSWKSIDDCDLVPGAKEDCGDGEAIWVHCLPKYKQIPYNHWLWDNNGNAKSITSEPAVC